MSETLRPDLVQKKFKKRRLRTQLRLRCRRVTPPPHHFPIHDPNFSLTDGGGASAGGPRLHSFWEEDMGHLTLREALASNRLDAFVREQQDDGAELAIGSELNGDLRS